MSSWSSDNYDDDGSEDRAVARYTPKDLTDTREFTRQIEAIENDQTLTVLDRFRYRRQIMRAVFSAKQREINHHLDSFENYLLARKDVEAKAITLEAQKAIMVLEKEQLEMMKKLGLEHSGDISDTLISAGKMMTRKLNEIAASDMLPDIKAMTFNSVRGVWKKTFARIKGSVDTYMTELYEKERTRPRPGAKP